MSNYSAAITIFLAYFALNDLRQEWWIATKNRHILLRSLRGPFDEDAIHRFTSYFIEPNCQNIDPAGEAEIRFAGDSTKAPLFRILDRFIEMDTSYKHLMILADSGTEKTTSMLNYYARNERMRRKKYHIAIIPLGHYHSDRLIADLLGKPEIEPEKTVIILDGFDEDILAIVDHYARIKELMHLCEKFKRVIITCRTQFFRMEDEIPKDTGIVRFGPRKLGEGKNYEFRKLYLSPFDDRDVRLYLRKRYPFWMFRTSRKAMEIASKIPLLSVRPMLLAYIPELLYRHKISYTYQLYEIMIEAWLQRESMWINRDILREFSERLAIEIWLNPEKRKMERVPYEEPLQLAEKWGIKVMDWKLLTGRSLLNRDVEGNFKFAHRSIMEYLFVKRFLKLSYEDRPKLEWSDLMKSFLVEMIKHGTAGKNLQRVDLSSMDIFEIDLTDADLTDAILT